MDSVFVVTLLTETSDGVKLAISPAYETRGQALEMFYQLEKRGREAPNHSIEIHELAVKRKPEA